MPSLAIPSVTNNAAAQAAKPQARDGMPADGFAQFLNAATSSATGSDQGGKTGAAQQSDQSQASTTSAAASSTPVDPRAIGKSDGKNHGRKSDDSKKASDDAANDNQTAQAQLAAAPAPTPAAAPQPDANAQAALQTIFSGAVAASYGNEDASDSDSDDGTVSAAAAGNVQTAQQGSVQSSKSARQTGQNQPSQKVAQNAEAQTAGSQTAADASAASDDPSSAGQTASAAQDAFHSLLHGTKESDVTAQTNANKPDAEAAKIASNNSAQNPATPAPTSNVPTSVNPAPVSDNSPVAVNAAAATPAASNTPVSNGASVSANVQVTQQAPNINALAVDIAARSQSGAKQFDIRMDPPELGRVEVRLSIDASGKAQAHMTADQPQTLALLQKDAPALTQALRDAGLDVTQDGLNFSLKGQNQQSGNNAQDFQGSSASSGISASKSLDAAQSGSSFSSSGSGLLDIHV